MLAWQGRLGLRGRNALSGAGDPEEPQATRNATDFGLPYHASTGSVLDPDAWGTSEPDHLSRDRHIDPRPRDRGGRGSEEVRALEISISSRNHDLSESLLSTTRRKISRLGRLNGRLARAEVHFYEE